MVADGSFLVELDGTATKMAPQRALAAAQKVRIGDVILEISGTPVNSPDDLVNGIREANRLQRRAVLLRIRSGNETRFVAVQLRRN